MRASAARAFFFLLSLFPRTLSPHFFFEFATAPPSQPLSNDDDDAIEEEQGDIAIVVAEEEHAFSLDAVSKPHADASFVRLEEKEERRRGRRRRRRRIGRRRRGGHSTDDGEEGEEATTKPRVVVSFALAYSTAGGEQQATDDDEKNQRRRRRRRLADERLRGNESGQDEIRERVQSAKRTRDGGGGRGCKFTSEVGGERVEESFRGGEGFGDDKDERRRWADAIGGDDDGEK